MIFSRKTVYTTVCCLSLVFPSLVHADAPVVDPTSDYNNSSGNTNPDAADYAGSSNPSSVPDNSQLSNSSSDNSAANNGNSSASFPSSAQSLNNQPPTDNSASNEAINSSLPIDQRVAQLERQIAAMNQLNLLQQVNQLQQQVQDLTGQLEVATHSLQVLQDQQKNQYADLDQRLSHLENPTANKLSQQSTGQNGNINTPANVNNNAINSANSGDQTTDNAPVNSNNQSAANDTSDQQSNGSNTNVATNSAPDNSNTNTATNIDTNNALQEQAAYQKAYNLIKNKDYTGATTGMAAFVKQYPNSSYALNAHYWLGEMYLLQNMPAQAAVEFNSVIKYPQNPKTGDAMLKLGFAYADEQKWTLARKQLMLVQTRYTGTTTGQLASERLKEMKLQGH